MALQIQRSKPTSFFTKTDPWPYYSLLVVHAAAKIQHLTGCYVTTPDHYHHHRCRCSTQRNHILPYPPTTNF